MQAQIADKWSSACPPSARRRAREIQPCFANIALLQAFLSIGGWVWLAYVLARHLKHAVAKLLAAAIITLFAFTPPIAGWDNVLVTESLSLSLFALSLGFLIEGAFLLVGEAADPGSHPKVIYTLGFIFFTLWLFTKDANLMAIPALLITLIPLLVSKGFRARRFVLKMTIILVGLLALGLITSRQSQRWQLPLRNAVTSFVLPYPARVQFLREHFSMPDPGSAEYETWFQRTAPTAYLGFLLSHPGFDVTTILDNWVVFTHTYEQPYYRLESGSGLSLAAAAWRDASSILGRILSAGQHCIDHRLCRSSDQEKSGPVRVDGAVCVAVFQPPFSCCW